MKRFLPLLLLFVCFGTAYGQNPEGFDKMAENMAGNMDNVITMEKVHEIQKENKSITFLDTREYAEHKVSHIKNSIFVGYNKINWDKIMKLDKDAIIVVYCSVGYRSGKVAEKMIELGFTNVTNLYGGLFNWANNGGVISTTMGTNTNEIHGFSKKWSQWINKEKCQVIL